MKRDAGNEIKRAIDFEGISCFFWLWDSIEILEINSQLILGLRYIVFFAPAARESRTSAITISMLVKTPDKRGSWGILSQSLSEKSKKFSVGTKYRNEPLKQVDLVNGSLLLCL